VFERESGAIDWPPPEADMRHVRWGYYGALVDMTPEIRGRFDGKAQVRGL
jgi:hypothetical protein